MTTETDGAGSQSPATDQDLVKLRTVAGRKAGDQYVRVVEPFSASFRRSGSGHLVAAESVLEPHGVFGRGFGAVRRTLIGKRIASSRDIHERIGWIRGLAVFASDNISSSAYASEEIMRVLLLAGAGALALTMPLTVGIVVVLAIVVISYQQTIRAYPNGGGSYIVASDNLGTGAGSGGCGRPADRLRPDGGGLGRGWRGRPDLDLPAAVSTSGSLSASACVIALWLGNMRGIRESANIFADPDLRLPGGDLRLAGVRPVALATGTMPAYVPPASWLEAHGSQTLGILLIMRAFASGSVALTGTEAVSNGVPAFKPPEAQQAGRVLILMGLFFGTIFLGISFLASVIGIVPDPTEQETVISQLARTVVGADTPFHYLVQISTALLLILAANTAFADFPRLASILAKDGFLPHQFQFRGERLAFSVGIVVLAVLAGLLIVVFEGSVTQPHPAVHGRGLRRLHPEPVGHGPPLAGGPRRPSVDGDGARSSTGLGAVATGTVAIFVGVAKFALGAWFVLLLIPMLMAVMWAISRHYRAMDAALALPADGPALVAPRPPRVIVPISRLDRAALGALAYATSISPNVTAVHVATDAASIRAMRDRWEAWAGPVRLVILESPYRALMAPLLGVHRRRRGHGSGPGDDRRPGGDGARPTSGNTRSTTRPHCA